MKKVRSGFELKIDYECPYCNEAGETTLSELQDPLYLQIIEADKYEIDIKETLFRGLLRVVFHGEEQIGEIPIICKNPKCKKKFIIEKLYEK